MARYRQECVVPLSRSNSRLNLLTIPNEFATRLFLVLPFTVSAEFHKVTDASMVLTHYEIGTASAITGLPIGTATGVI